MSVREIQMACSVVLKYLQFLSQQNNWETNEADSSINFIAWQIYSCFSNWSRWLTDLQTRLRHQFFIPQQSLSANSKSSKVLRRQTHSCSGMSSGPKWLFQFSYHSTVKSQRNYYWIHKKLILFHIPGDKCECVQQCISLNEENWRWKTLDFHFRTIPVH